MKIKVKAVLLIIFILVGALVLTACNVDVESVSISGPDIAAVNVETQYTATVSPSDATHRQVTWAITGDNTVGATISDEGIFKATAVGSVTITATAWNKSDSKTITVQFIEATAVSVSNVSGVVGNPITLKANLTPSDASNTVTYSLVDNTIGAVLTGNQVTCGNLGTVSYKATVGSLESNTATITFNLDPANGETITTAEQLNAVRNNLSGKFQLGADIDLGGYTNWTPIGTSSAPFTGALSGNGYTIQNLTINSLSTEGIGLFGKIGGSGVVRNLKIVANINAGMAGGIAGTSDGTITGCEVSGTIGKNNADYVGGIVAKQTGGNISGNKNNATVIGNNYVGGIVGAVKLNKSNLQLDNCENNGEISGLGNIGGIAGSVEIPDRYSGCNVSSCVNNGKVTGTGDNVGGIAGYAAASYTTTYILTFASCENKSDVSGRNYVGGYAGLGIYTNFTGLVNTQTITGKAYVGGIAGKGVEFSNCENMGAINASGTVAESGNTNAYVGGIAGCAGSISNCENEINITYAQNGQYVGGIAGFVSQGSISNSQNSGKIVSYGNFVGGIAGKVMLSISNGKLDNCENNGEISGLGNIGGIAGSVEIPDRYSGCSVSSCVNNGKVTGTGNNVGGIAGYAAASYTTTYILTIASCENKNDVSGQNYVGGYAGLGIYTNFAGLANAQTITGKAYVGGIAGKGVEFSNCENIGAISASGTVAESGNTNAYVGGIAGYAGSISNCVNEINITYTQNGQYVGGISGFVNKGSVTNSQNSGKITSNGNFVGGISGKVMLNISNGKLDNCENNGEISGLGNVGGIAGSVEISDRYSGCSVSSCVNNGKVTGTGDNVGGIAGYASTSYSGSYALLFSSCINNANIIGRNYVAGILGNKGNYISTPSNCTNSVGLAGITATGGANKYDIMP